MTEAATGHFRWTAPLALLAGAGYVTAVARDSRYGSATEACNAVTELAEHTGLAGRLETTESLDAIADAEIITNLGALRPLNESHMQRMKRGTAVPLMCEAWEYREGDLDLAAAFENDIIVLGTNEHHPALDFMRYVGLLAVRLGLDAGVELFRSRVVVVGGGVFGSAVVAALRANGAEVSVVSPTNESHDSPECWIAPDIAAAEAVDLIRLADLLVFADYTTSVQHIGANGCLRAGELHALNPSIAIAHISGLIDADACRHAGLHVTPGQIATTARRMSITTAHLGVRPVLELHGAGLKVGEISARAWKAAGGNATRAREIALLNPLCQEFPESILSRHAASPFLREVA